MKNRHSIGVSTIATMNEEVSARETVMGRSWTNSPIAPFSIIIGMKEAMIVSVAVRIGTTRSDAFRHAAVHLLTPLSKRST